MCYQKAKKVITKKIWYKIKILIMDSKKIKNLRELQKIIHKNNVILKEKENNNEYDEL